MPAKPKFTHQREIDRILHRREKLDAGFGAMRHQLGPLRRRKFKTLEHLEFAFGDLLALALIGEGLGLVGAEFLRREGLELDAIGADLFRRIDHLLRKRHLAVMIGAGFRHDIGGKAVPDLAARNRDHRAHARPSSRARRYSSTSQSCGLSMSPI